MDNLYDANMLTDRKKKSKLYTFLLLSFDLFFVILFACLLIFLSRETISQLRVLFIIIFIIISLLNIPFIDLCILDNRKKYRFLRDLEKANETAYENVDVVFANKTITKNQIQFEILLVQINRINRELLIEKDKTSLLNGVKQASFITKNNIIVSIKDKHYEK